MAAFSPPLASSALSSFFSSFFLCFDSVIASVFSLKPFSFPVFSITTKFFVLLKGLHSLILTMSPSFASIHLGLCAFILVLLRSYLSYFGRKYFQDHSTVTVLCIFADTTVPVKVLPLHFRLPWNGHFLSPQPSLPFLASFIVPPFSLSCPLL